MNFQDHLNGFSKMRDETRSSSSGNKSHSSRSCGNRPISHAATNKPRADHNIDQKYHDFLNGVKETNKQPTQQRRRARYATGGHVNDHRQAKKLEKMGRNGDTQLVHVNKQEERMLKNAGGRGSVNPKTGLREYMFEECSIHPGEDVKNCPECTLKSKNTYRHTKDGPQLGNSCPFETIANQLNNAKEGDEYWNADLLKKYDELRSKGNRGSKAVKKLFDNNKINMEENTKTVEDHLRKNKIPFDTHEFGTALANERERNELKKKNLKKTLLNEDEAKIRDVENITKIMEENGQRPTMYSKQGFPYDSKSKMRHVVTTADMNRYTPQAIEHNKKMYSQDRRRGSFTLHNTNKPEPERVVYTPKGSVFNKQDYLESLVHPGIKQIIPLTDMGDGNRYIYKLKKPNSIKKQYHSYYNLKW
jgi:hypothetical protein